MGRLLVTILVIGLFLMSACGDTSTPEPAPAPTDEPAPAPEPVPAPEPEPTPAPTPSPTPEEKTSPAPTSPETPATSTSPAPTDEPPPAPEPEQIKASDDSVTIVLDKIERADVMPDDIVEALSVGRTYQSPAPSAGCDFFCIYLTITRIENIHMIDAFGYGEEETALFNAAPQKYERIAANLKGITFLDPQNLTGSYEIVEGATAFWVFEVPKDEDPLRFEFVYTFKVTIEEETERGGKIDIIIE